MTKTKLLTNLAGAFGLAATMQAHQIAPAYADQNLDSCRHIESGRASWYGPGFHGKTAANGKPFNQNALTVAHMSLPFGTELTIRNPENGNVVEAVVTDRGAFDKYNRILDGSKAVADALGYRNKGVTRLDLYAC